MRTRAALIVVFHAAFLLGASPAMAQYGARAISDRATGETYRVEVGGHLWNPDPDILISSESLGIPGDEIDYVNDLGIEQSRFKQLKVVLRPSTTHKFRFEYTPIGYDAQKVVQRSFTFNGQRYNIGIPVTTTLDWKAYRFGYEWDFVYRNRGFAGLVLDLKYTDIQTQLSALVGTEFAHAKAPIPAIGFIGRGYVVPNISITGEFSFFKIPDSVSEDYKGKYYDFDLYGTVNFTEHFGAQLGYRSFDVYYKVKKDTGDLTLKGIYFGGVARY